jgi:aryl-alcohol dehydrogenase-like predicted oxidoreductase
MEQRRVGKQGLIVSAIGLGCLEMTGTYGKADKQESILTTDRALELGVNYLDTADAYGLFKNEEFVGRAIRRKRDRIILATKFGSIRSTDSAGSGLRDTIPRGHNGAVEFVALQDMVKDPEVITKWRNVGATPFYLNARDAGSIF